MPVDTISPNPNPPKIHSITIIAFLLLLAWSLWWTLSFLQSTPKLLLPKFPPSALYRYQFIGVDFIHNYAGVQTWHNGIDPYLHLIGDPINPVYICTPPALPLFSWTLALPATHTLLSNEHNNLPHLIPYPTNAIFVWFIASIAMFIIATAFAQTARQRLQLPPLSLPLMLVITLFSYPVLFELERGNFNILILLLIALGSLPWLSPKSPALRHEISTGICFAMAAALKVFPLILLPGLLVMRKFLAAAVMLLTLLLLWLALFNLTASWTRIAAVISHEQADAIPLSMHSLSIIWHHLWSNTPLDNLSPTLGSLLLIAPPAAIVSLFLFRSPNRNPLLYPFALWLAALGTCAMQISVDYNLLLLLTATLILWNPRDPLWLQLTLLPWLLILQPLQLGPDSFTQHQWFPITLLIMKLWSILAVGLLLIHRTRGLTPSPDTSRIH